MRPTFTALILATLLGSGAASALDRPRHLNDAIRSQKRIASARPDDAGVLNDLGNLLTLAGHLEEAEEAYRRALTIVPDDSTTHYNLALLLRLDGRPRQAVRELERAVTLDPDDAWGHYQLGVLLEEKDKTTKAARHFARAFVLDPSLTEFETNPQLLDSHLTTRAMMMAYEERVARAEMAPRQYAQPKRITRLLVPEVRGARQRTGAEVEDEAPKKQRRGRKKRAGDGGS